MEDERVRSVIWNYFDRRKINDTIFGFWKIGKCSQKISCPTSSTTGLFTHLRSYHKKESAECDKKAQEAKRMKKEENKAGKQLSVSVTDLWVRKQHGRLITKKLKNNTSYWPHVGFRLPNVRFRRRTRFSGTYDY